MVARYQCHPQGPKTSFKGMTTATSGVLARFPLLFPFRNSCELRGLCRHSYFGPRTFGGGETNVIEMVMSTFVFSSQHKECLDAEYRTSGRGRQFFVTLLKGGALHGAVDRSEGLPTPAECMIFLCLCVCLLLQDLLQSCSRGRVEDINFGIFFSESLREWSPKKNPQILRVCHQAQIVFEVLYFLSGRSVRFLVNRYAIGDAAWFDIFRTSLALVPVIKVILDDVVFQEWVMQQL
jgi:hypothetical protein